MAQISRKRHDQMISRVAKTPLLDNDRLRAEWLVAGIILVLGGIPNDP